MKYFFPLIFIACQGPELENNGMVLDINTAQFKQAISDLVAMQAEEYKDKDWPKNLNKLSVNVMTFDKYVPCGNGNALGCTLYDGYPSTMFVMRTLKADAFEDIAISHELGHIYLCKYENDCDPWHLKDKFWDANERAYHRWVALYGKTDAKNR